MKSYASYFRILDRIGTDISPDLIRKYQIYCETGDWLDSAVLKLQKPSWTDGGIGQGIFFSIWLGEKELKENRLNYNIHALKLRLRHGYSIKPREFASSFRVALAASGEAWPNLSTGYGPQTLMQGWFPLHLETFRDDVMHLVERFVGIHEVIDEMLAKRKKA